MESSNEINRKIAGINRGSSKARSWSIAKRDVIKFRGDKLKARQFIKLVVSSLPVVRDEISGTRIDHRENLIKVYCSSGLVGTTEYEKMIHNLKSINDTSVDFSGLSNKLTKSLYTYFDKDLNKVTMSDITKISIEEFSRIRGVGKTTVAQLVEFIKTL